MDRVLVDENSVTLYTGKALGITDVNKIKRMETSELTVAMKKVCIVGRTTADNSFRTTAPDRR